jgi:hemerythrin superfamily protein
MAQPENIAMPDTRVLAPNPARLLRQEHERIRRLFALHGRTAPEETADREALFRLIRREMLSHGALEARHFYSAINIGDASLQDDHAAMEGLLEKLALTKSTDKSYDALMKLLEENFALHAAAEERELFPKLDRLGVDRLQALTIALEYARHRREEDL